MYKCAQLILCLPTGERLYPQNPRDAIGKAVRYEHQCDDNTCEIAAAMHGGFVLAAHRLLSDAMETPVLDVVADVLDRLGASLPFPMTGEYEQDMEDFRAWVEPRPIRYRACRA